MECSHGYMDYFFPLESLYYLRLPNVGICAMTQSEVVPFSPEKQIKTYMSFESAYIKYIKLVIILLLFHLVNRLVNGLVNT